MIVLGIETSCDETSAGVVRGGCEVLSNVVASQANLHARYGGVVPEVASRKHLECMLPVVLEALDHAGVTWRELGGLAVTNRPGLLGALLVGVSAAKALAYALKIPIAPVHHLEGHLYSTFLAAPDLTDQFPLLALIVSGGHTQIIRMDRHCEYQLLGTTRDDAAGEAFDKGARLLNLPYPGGPEVAALASQGDPARVLMPRSYLGDTLDFSFSGVKTALRTFIARDNGKTNLADIAAGYQEAIVVMLTRTLQRAIHSTGIKTFCVCGGVAANRRLQESMKAMAQAEGCRLILPDTQLCTDNAAMIAAAGWYRLQHADSSPLSFDTLAVSPLALATISS